MQHSHALDIGTTAYDELADRTEMLGLDAPADTDALLRAAAMAVVSRGIASLDELESVRGDLAQPYDGGDASRAALISFLMRDRFCGEPDGGEVDGQRVLAYGAAYVPWEQQSLTWRVDPTGAQIFGPGDLVLGGGGGDESALIASIVGRAFDLWENALPGHFSFTQVTADADIGIDFRLDPTVSAIGRGKGPSEPAPYGTDPYRQRGTIRLRAARDVGDRLRTMPWSQASLGKVVAHEIGHVLGLQHSNRRTSLMYPYSLDDGWDFHAVDPESRRVLRDLYGWRYLPFPDGRASAYAPSLARTSTPGGIGTGTGSGRSRSTLHMVWTGPRGVAGLSYSRSRDRGETWSPAQPVRWPTGGTPVHGTALTAYASGDDPAADTLFLAWAGEQEQLWYAPDLADPVALTAYRLEGQTSDRRPALAAHGGTVHLAWKSNGDQRVWWTSYRRGAWSTVVAIPSLITEHAPALGVNEGRVMAVVRNPGSGLLVESELLPDGRWTQPRAVTTFNYEGGPGTSAAAGESPAHTTTTTHGPAAATLADGGMMLCLRRANGRLATVRRGRDGGGAIALWKHFSDRGPALVAADEDVVAAWVGPDQKLARAIRSAPLEITTEYEPRAGLPTIEDILRNL